MKTNIDRDELLGELETMIDSVQTVADDIEETIISEAPRNRAEFGERLQKLGADLTTLGKKYQTKKDGTLAAAKSTEKGETSSPVEATDRASVEALAKKNGEAFFNLSSRIRERRYIFGTSDVVSVSNPRYLVVKRSGNRHVYDAAGVRHVISKGYRRYEDIR